MANEKSTNSPWLRRIVVTLGPLAEWQNKPKGEIVQFKSDGTPDGLRITGQFSKTIMGMPSPSTISIYNLTEDTRNAIKGSLTKVTVEAGWSNTDLRKEFQGSVLNSFSERNGSDIVTKIICLPGYGAMVRGVSSITFSAGTPLKTAVKTLAANLPGINVSDNHINGITGKIGNRGFSFAGSTKDALTRMAEEYGFSWSIQDGNVNVIGDSFMLKDYYELNGEDGGLISVTPILSGPMQLQTGVNINALHIPGLTAGKTIRIKSSISKKYSGDYRIHTMKSDIDAYAESWRMSIESFKHGRKI